MRDHQLTGNTRVFLLEGRARPSQAPSYEGLARAGAFSWPQGDTTLIRRPNPHKYNSFLVVGKVSGEPGVPELPLTIRYTDQLSKMLRLARTGCDFDVQVHMGACENPADFNRGWAKIIALDSARITSYGTTDLGALGPDENAVINEEVPVTGEDAYEIVRLTFAEKAAAQVTREIVDITVCDTEACGECGTTSDGCQKIFALMGEADASPGASPAVLYSSDGGNTWALSSLLPFTPAEEADSLDCMGDNLFVVSQDAGSIAYAPVADVLAGTAVWTEVTTGFVTPAGAPRKVLAVSPVFAWIIGAGGYVYVSTDLTAGVEVQDAGSATTQVLNDISAIDEFNAVAVGASNAVIVTTNGGDTWQSILGPAVGVALNAVAMKSQYEWIVGTAGGQLWYTQNGGTSWTQKAFPGSGGGQVRDIQFFNKTIGYMAHDTALAVGRLFRTIDGGNSWYALPEQTGFTIPTNDKLNAIAVCADPNVVFAGGLGANAVDGIIIKGAGE